MSMDCIHPTLAYAARAATVGAGCREGESAGVREGGVREGGRGAQLSVGVLALDDEARAPNDAGQLRFLPRKREGTELCGHLQPSASVKPTARFDPGCRP